MYLVKKKRYRERNTKTYSSWVLSEIPGAMKDYDNLTNGKILKEKQCSTEIIQIQKTKDASNS